MTNIQIIQADLDREDHQRAIVALIDGYAGDAMGIGRGLPSDVLERMIPGLREHPTCLIWLAYVGADPAGIAVCFRGFSTFLGRPIINIHDFAISPSWQRRGIGRRLMERVMDEARAGGCAKVTLEVREDNAAAQALYRAVGFEPYQPQMQFWSRKL